MKVLYISPENTAGTLNLWKESHELLGNNCTFITLYKSKHFFDPGHCLELPLISVNTLYLKGRHNYYKLFRGKQGDYKERAGYPPIWHPNSFFERYYFKFRDWVWHFKVEPFIEKMKLYDYDVYHLEWGLEFYRDGRFVKKLFELNKPIICTYHGQDLRTRGVIPINNSLSKLNLTSELDLMKKHPKINYLFLPYNTNIHNPSFEVNKVLRICHSPTNRYYKGSDTIIEICNELAIRDDVEFVLIEGKSHQETQNIKQTCDIFIDQIYNRGGWGYGMNSVEALSMGMCCLTELVKEYETFLPNHPFININHKNLKKTLEDLIKNKQKIIDYKKRARQWVIKYHSSINVTKQLYKYYKQFNII